jgi:hypothetical protein
LQGPDLLLAVLGWMSATLKMGTRPRKGTPFPQHQRRGDKEVPHGSPSTD